jgi:hypothetical protein
MVRAACSEGASPPDRIDPSAIMDAVSAAPSAEEAVLVGLARRFGLSDGELLAATLCLAVESDPHTARLVAAAQAPVGGSRPLAGFAATVFGGVGLDCVGLASGTAARIGLLVLGDEAAPLTERSIRIPLPIVAALAGRRLEPERSPMPSGSEGSTGRPCS